MRIWLDALTPKQLLLMHCIAEELRARGVEVLLTVRDYDYIVTLAEELGEEPVVVGGYGGDLEGKLRADVERAGKLVDLVVEFKPDYLVSYTSPSAFRVAFGLKIRIVALSDSPHSIPVNRLTLPLADYLIFPRCIPRREFEVFVHPSCKLMQYDGVDEAAWMKRLSPDPGVLERLGLSPSENIVVFRPVEEKAAYYTYGKPSYLKLLRRLVDKARVVFFPRYEEQRRLVEREFGDLVIVPRRAVVLPKAYHFVSLVITGGASMAREAALVGTPAICMWPSRLYVNEYLEKLGFPIFNLPDQAKALSLALKVLESPDAFRRDVGELLKRVESPVDKVLEVLGVG